jgi:hypothetical protein
MKGLTTVKYQRRYCVGQTHAEKLNNMCTSIRIVNEKTVTDGDGDDLPKLLFLDYLDIIFERLRFYHLHAAMQA